MTPPPTSIDGTDITGATIDGQDVQRITIDRQTVFVAGPELPTTHLEHRYAADGITGLSGGNDVTTWNDSQGNNDIIAPSGREPTFETNVQNGLPVVRFSGNEVLKGGSGIISQPDHLIIVYKKDTSAGRIHAVFDSNDSTLTNRHVIFTDNDLSRFSFFGGTGNLFVTPLNTNFNIHTVLVNGANSQYRLNGVVEGTGDPGSDPLEGVQIGERSDGNFAFDGDVCEVLIYNDELTAQEVADAEAFLSAKWGITI